MDSAQMLANLRKLADWEGSELTTGFVEAQAGNPDCVQMLWKMKGETEFKVLYLDQKYQHRRRNRRVDQAVNSHWKNWKP